MKFNAAILFAAHIAGAFSATVPNAAAIEECGDLGVMPSLRAEELPEGVVLEKFRTCREHPLGNDLHLERASLAPMGADENEPEVDPDLTPNPTPTVIDALEKRACETKAPYGCSDGYCWKVCGGAGEWCWTAANGGFGDWLTCNQWNDCGTVTYACSRLCDSCGCSC
jgi:hypothetical protein